MAVCAGNGIPDSKGWEAPSDLGRSGRHHEYAKSLLSEKIILALVMTESQKTYFYVEKVFLSKAGIFFIYFC